MVVFLAVEDQLRLAEKLVINAVPTFNFFHVPHWSTRHAGLSFYETPKIYVDPDSKARRYEKRWPLS